MAPSEPIRSQERPFDPGLLSRVVRRDPSALEAFFEHYFDRVYVHVQRVVRDATLADDLVQEIFLRLHRSIESLDPSRDPSRWVFTVVVNVVRDHWRRRARSLRRGVAVDLDELWEQPQAGAGSDPQQQLEAQETARQIELALAALSPADREILTLRRDQELDSAAVAEILGISIEAVRQRLSRATARLDRHFRELEESGVSDA